MDITLEPVRDAVVVCKHKSGVGWAVLRAVNDGERT